MRTNEAKIKWERKFPCIQYFWYGAFPYMGYVHLNIIIMWKTRNYGKGKLLQQGYNTGDMWSFRNIIFFYFTVIFSYNGIRQELCKLTLSSPKHREQEAKESIPYKVSFYKQICFMHLSVILYSLKLSTTHLFIPLGGVGVCVINTCYISCCWPDICTDTHSWFSQDPQFWPPSLSVFHRVTVLFFFIYYTQ